MRACDSYCCNYKRGGGTWVPTTIEMTRQDLDGGLDNERKRNEDSLSRHNDTRLSIDRYYIIMVLHDRSVGAHLFASPHLISPHLISPHLTATCFHLSLFGSNYILNEYYSYYRYSQFIRFCVWDHYYVIIRNTYYDNIIERACHVGFFL